MRSKTPVRPRRLAPGSTVALVAPAGPLLEQDDLARAEALVRALGWSPVLADHAGDHHEYFAGRDDDRLADLNVALTAPGIDAVWCIRGGYGLTRILDRVDYAGAAAAPRVVLGFSDVTALLLALHHHTGLVTFHGPVARRELRPFSRRHLEAALTVAEPAGRLGVPEPGAEVLVPAEGRMVTLAGGSARGRLIGGNLSLLQCLVGTPHLPSLDGAILFLEDVGEDVYRIDRMLSHLRLAGLLDRLAGVVCGHFTEMRVRGADGAAGLDRVLGHYLAPLGVPVLTGVPVGHIDDQWTLPVGIEALLDADRQVVELLEPAVE